MQLGLKMKDDIELVKRELRYHQETQVHHQSSLISEFQALLAYEKKELEKVDSHFDMLQA